ncbi:2,5-dichloro-2,5-cyclohexadiene-1,4-diol dehydrogenase [Colletotrichum fructicola]|nr:2,5-dichloro-2,5-cyclohexadiene-1,4-diol dehydrogenase [Colletotrichum fructicola]
MDLGLDLEGTIVVVTGAGGQIGQVIVEAFLKAGCFVAAIDIDDSRLKRQHDNLLPMECDTTDERSVFSAWSAVAMRFGSWPTVCVCAAALDLSFVKHHASITEMSAEQFRKTLDVNVTGTFITAKAWLSHIPRADGSSLVHLNSDQNFSLIIIGSEAGIMVVPGNPDYASSKSAVQYGLMLSLAPDAVRINPGLTQIDATTISFDSAPRFSGWPTAPAEPYILEVCKMAKLWFPDRVHFWHELAEGIPREKSDGYYGWDEVNKAEEELRQLTKDELS